MNQLQQAEEFQTILADYHLSSSAKKTLEQIKLVLLVAPSSSGRNTIIRELVKTGRYHFIVSDTTRQPRMNDGIMEQNGREYWFRSEAELLDDLRHGEFLEAAIIHGQQVSGISIRELETARSQEKIAINEVEIVGADNIHRAKPDATYIFVVPPSFDEWMQRFHARGTLPADEVRRRLQSAIREFSAALKHDYYTIVVNDQLAHTIAEVDRLASGGLADPATQTAARQITEQLLRATKDYLASGK